MPIDNAAFDRWQKRIEIFLNNRPLDSFPDFDYDEAYDAGRGPMDVAEQIKRMAKRNNQW